MKEPYLPHPNLSPDLNADIAESALQGGVWVRQPFGELVKGEPFLPVGHGLTITTRNTTYTLDKTGADEFLISGHQKYCPAPTKCSIHGSTWGGSMLKVGWIGRGMHLEFSIEGKTVTTTTVQEVVERKMPLPDRGGAS